MTERATSARFLLWFFVAVAVMLCAADAYAQGGLERCLPEDTLAYVSANDLSSYRRSFEKTALYDIGQEPSVRPVIDQIKKLVEDTIKEELGMSVDGLGKVFTGQVVLAVTELDVKAEKVAAVFAGDVAPAEVPKLKELLSAIEARVRGSMPLEQPQTVTYKGTQIVLYQAEELIVCYCFPTGRFALSVGTSGRQAMETFLDGLARPPRSSLARSAEFRHIFRKIGRGSNSFAFFNVEALLDRALHGQDDDQAARVIDTLGLRNVKAIGASSTIVGKGFKDVTYFHAPAERRGVMSLFTAHTGLLDMLKYFPEDVSSVSAFNLDLPKLWRELQSIMRQLEPEDAEEMAEGIAQFEQKFELSVEKDVVSMFDGPLAVGMAGAPLPLPQVLIAAKLQHGAQPERIIGKLLSAAEQQPAETEYLGHKIFSIIIENAPVAPSYTVYKDCLLVSTNPQTLKSTLSRLTTPSRSAADSRALKDALSRVPKPGMAFSYSDTAAGFTTLYTALMPLLQSQQQNIPVNLAELPPAEVISKHLFPAVSSTTVDKEGITSMSYGPFGGAAFLGAAPGGPASAGIAAAVSLPALARAREAARRASCQNNLKQMGLVFKMYANEHAGRFPVIDDRRGNLAPEGDQIFPEYLVDPNILRCFSDRDHAPIKAPYTADDVTDQSYFYLGWVVLTEQEGLALLDAYESLDLDRRDDDIEVGEGKGSAGGNKIYRVYEGVERKLIKDTNNPAAAALQQSQTPVMVERIGHHTPDGGNVLYMDGHVEFIRYPGMFPMTVKFMERLKQVSTKKTAE